MQKVKTIKWATLWLALLAALCLLLAGCEAKDVAQETANTPANEQTQDENTQNNAQTSLTDFKYSGQDEITITKYLGNAATVQIPAQINGAPVTAIADYAFAGCTDLIDITIPDSVTSIGEHAFGGCVNIENATMPIIGTKYIPQNHLINVTLTSGERLGFFDVYVECEGVLYGVNLTSVTLPESLTSICAYAFNGSDDGFPKLTNITIPDSVTSIGTWAFIGCTGLTSVTIGSGVTSIGERAFYGCTGLTSITVAAGNTVYHSAGNCLIETASGTLIAGCNASVIPDDGSVTSIDDQAFYGCTGLTGITIPDSVTSVGEQTFSGCTSLTSVTIPDTVTSIGYYAFYGCTGLTSITIPDSVTSIGDGAFSGCTGLTSVYITDLAAWCGISFSYDANPLQYAHNLYLDDELVTELVIPEGVTNISAFAFYGCTSLTSVTIPDSVTSIGSWAFSGCDLKRAAFKTVSDWQVKHAFENYQPTVISTADVEQNAVYLCSTYFVYVWTRQ